MADTQIWIPRDVMSSENTAHMTAHRMFQFPKSIVSSLVVLCCIPRNNRSLVTSTLEMT